MNFYLQIFIESLWTASLIPLSRPATYFAMAGFGSYPMLIPYLLAVTGSMCGHIFNWMIGRLIYRFVIKHPRFNHSDYEKASQFFKRYMLPLLLLCWNNMMNYFSTLAAFLNVSPRVAFLLILIGQMGYFGWYILKP